jgi:ATP-dependent DNA ligase
MKTFNKLYRQGSTGAIQEWQVSVAGSLVRTTYGQVGGAMQTTTDIVKNCRNSATLEDQALAQAQQDYDRKLKKGYQPDLAKAKSTKNVLAAIEPMLAFPIEKKPKAVVFPALAQPKLDGLRCIAIIEDGKAKLFSRTQKPILTVPHIVAELEVLYKGMDIIIDGELYSHKLSADFNAITHLVKRDDVHPDSRTMELHQYDVVGDTGWKERTKELSCGKYCMIVETVEVNSMEDLMEYQAKCIGQGFEGCMFRNPTGAYENKRSANLLKVKTFEDSEFKITGAEEGTGRLMGAIGAFTLVTEAGVAFKAKPACTLAQSQAYWRDRKSYVGKMGTVKFQGRTPDGSLRFPVFKAVRD